MPPARAGTGTSFAELLFAYCANSIGSYTNGAAGCQGDARVPWEEIVSIIPPAPPSQVNRRQFLRAATVAAVAPMIVPRHVIAGSPGQPPSDRIPIGDLGA